MRIEMPSTVVVKARGRFAGDPLGVPFPSGKGVGILDRGWVGEDRGPAEGTVGVSVPDCATPGALRNVSTISRHPAV
jgi:hypothetical protein